MAQAPAMSRFPRIKVYTPFFRLYLAHTLSLGKSKLNLESMVGTSPVYTGILSHHMHPKRQRLRSDFSSLPLPHSSIHLSSLIKPHSLPPSELPGSGTLWGISHSE